MTVHNQGFAILLELVLHFCQESLVVSLVVLDYQISPLMGLEGAPEPIPIGSPGVDHPHAYLAHRLLGVIWKTLDIYEQSRDGEPDCGGLWQEEELVSERIGHQRQLSGEIGI